MRQAEIALAEAYAITAMASVPASTVTTVRSASTKLCWVKRKQWPIGREWRQIMGGDGDYVCIFSFSVVEIVGWFWEWFGIVKLISFSCG